MNKLNKVFEQNQILTAEELNAITGKVDEIVTLLSSLDSGNSTITDAQILAKIDTAKAELNRLLSEAIANVQQNIESLRSVVNGKTEVITESEWAQYRAKVDETGNRLASMILLLEGEINIASLRETVDNLNSLMSSLHIEPGKLELIAGLFDENDNLIINPASIIAAIVDSDGKLTSEIAISADQVILDGDVTLTQGLTSMRGEITNLTSSNATIRDRLTAAESVIGNKTDNSDFQNLVGNLNDLSLVVNGKAAVEDLIALSARVDELDVTGTATVSSLLAKGSTDYPRVVINSTDGIQLLTSASASAININMDGSGSLANGNITWDTNGNLTINGTFKVGAKYIEYIYDNSVTANVSFSDTQAGLQANVTVTNTNNFDVYCNVQWYADGTNNIWSASGVTDIIRVAANSSRTIEDGIAALDIQGYSSATHPSIDTNNAGADLVNIYHYIDRNS